MVATRREPRAVLERLVRWEGLGPVKFVVAVSEDVDLSDEASLLWGIFTRFGKVMTVEINYSDEPDDPYVTDENRRRGQLALLLRAQTLADVDCWTRVPGEPLRPGRILAAIRGRLGRETTP